MNNLNELYEAILAGKLEQAVSVTREAVAGGAAPQEIINEYMIKAMEAIGARFESGQVFVPNLLMSARAMRGALDILKPLMQGQVNSYIGRIVIGTVKGDLHDIGSAALENKADIICMSALLTTTMNYMKEVIDALETSGLRGKVKVMVGGAPVSDAFAKSIGADAYTSNANAAVIMAKKLINAC